MLYEKISKLNLSFLKNTFEQQKKSCLKIKPTEKNK